MPVAVPLRIQLVAALLTLAASWAPAVSTAQPIPPLSPADQPEIDVLLDDGRRYRGTLVTSDAERIVVRTSGIDVPIQLDDIARIDRLPTVRERYEALRASLDEYDVTGRLHLAEWLRDRGAYELALREARGVLEIEPYSGRASSLKLWLESQIALLDRGPVVRREREASEQASRRELFPTLTPEQVNIMRVYEVDLTDPPRLRIGAGTVDRLFERYADHELIPRTQEGRSVIKQWPPEQVLELLFRVQARDLYEEVLVLDDPEAIRLFRTRVHGRWLINSCASAACHGGAAAGRLYLNRTKPNSTATVYTNLLILDRFRLDDGRPLISYQNPAESPLLHLALPHEVSNAPHPRVGSSAGRRGWRPIFDGTDDRQFRQAVEWIAEMYSAPTRPGYPIDYEPPTPPTPVPPLAPGEQVDR